MIKFDITGIEYPARDNFIALEKLLNESPVMGGTWKLFERELEPGTYTVPHRLGFRPLDVILLHESGSGVVAFNYAAFTDADMTFTVSTGLTRFRFLIGKAR